jgi:hypothetical protein
MVLKCEWVAAGSKFKLNLLLNKTEMTRILHDILNSVK